MRAFELSEGLRCSIKDYLQELAFPIEAALKGSNDLTDLPAKLEKFLDSSSRDSGAGFVSPLFIERQMPYKVSENSLDSIEGLDPDVALAFAKYLLDSPQASTRDIHLYQHQENSFRTVNHGRNLVVCTGTGSGKTECFLLPLVDAIVKERKAAHNNGLDYPSGVRAMILYPMNALVNDQVRRLRRFIQYLPEEIRPTFGLFTGDLKPHEREIDEGKIETMRQYFREDGFTFVEARNDDVVINSDVPIRSQYTHRWEWTKRGPADILVTNYSMLERLLLTPKHANIFDIRTWRFIVLDEAHSYTGSNGTEIAWLIRRLAHRVKPGEASTIQYIATSATLKTGKPEEVSDFIKYEFASKIFPAGADTFDVELEQYQSITRGFGKAYDGNLAELCADPVYDKTVRFLRERKHNGMAMKCAIIIQKLLETGNHWSTQQAYCIMNMMPNLSPGDVVFKATPNIVNLIRFALSFYGEGDDDWATCLHNALDPRKRRIANGGRQWTENGNRLDILRQWKKIRRHEINGITYEQFSYLYSRCLEAMNDLPEEDFSYSLENLEVELADDFVTKLNNFVEETISCNNQLNQQQADLITQWAARLGIDGETHLESILYKALCDRNDMVRFQDEICKSSGCHSFDSVAQQLYGEDINAKEQLSSLLDLGMMAVNSGDRLPLLDIRYHQMVRGLADNEVAVEFPNGTPNSLTLHRTLETSWGQDNNFLFNLGACRECGMPYLLAYSKVADLTQEEHSILVRDYSDAYRYLHAFALCPGGEEHQLEMDAQPEAEDATPQANAQHRNAVYVNLKTGQCSNQPIDGWQKVYWYRHGSSINNNARNNNARCRFIGVCPNCENPQPTSNAEYGVITPYFGTDEMMRLFLLKEFAEQAEPEVDPVIQSKPGSGKKVLAFADSRRGAASGAFRFHDLFSRMYLNELVVESVKEAEDNPQVSREDIRRRLLQQLPPGLPDNTIDDIVNAELAQPLSLSKVAAILKKKVEDKKCYHLLQFVNRQRPLEFLEDDSAIICVLRVLRDFARRGVIKSKRVELDFKLPDDFGNDIIFNGMNIPELPKLVNEIFRRLWWNIEIEIPEEWAATYIDSRPNRMHCYDKESHNGSRRQDGHGYYPAVKSFSNGRICKNILKKHIRNHFPNTQISDREVQGILEQIRNRLQNSLLVRNEDAGGWGLNLGYLRENLVLHPGQSTDIGNTAISPLRIEEHTAQLSTEMGRVYQNAFSNGDINILSCSTTFEMGIDVGGVNRVFLMTIPPGTANYKQRAGRAGRRPGAAAFILSYATANSQDEYYFEHPDKLYGGKIEPPHIYLDKPTFRERHLRAVALACFLKWMVGRPECTNGDWWHKAWERTERFFFGYRTGEKNQDKTFPISNLDNPEPLVALLPAWRQDAAAVRECRDAIIGIPDIGDSSPEVVMNDLLFQMGGLKMCSEAGQEAPFPLVKANSRNYQELCGPNLLERSGDILVESDNPMRKNVMDRMDYRLRTILNWRGQARFDKKQKNLMLRHPFDVFSEFSIVPKYGFPIDVIELEVQDKDVELSRDLSLGLYEYAPGQIVYANKKAFKSKGFESDEGYQKIRQDYWECIQCHRFYPQEGDGICPNCHSGGLLQKTDKFFTKPSKFRGERISADDFHEKRGIVQQMYCGGIQEGYAKSNGCALIVGESDSQLMRYINAGIDGNGYPPNAGEDPEVLFHEVITNIAIWSIPDEIFNTLNFKNLRRQTALRSVKYALQAAAARVLNVDSRDIGVLVQRLQGVRVPHCTESFVIFDNASGGGGIVLPLYEPNAPEVTEIVKEAWRLCAECTCGGTQSPGIEQEPLPMDEYLSRVQGGENVDRIRPTVACSSCLKMFNNRNEHRNLDRWDAAYLLQRILETPIQTPRTDDNPSQNGSLPAGFVPFDVNEPLRRGKTYLLQNDSRIVCGSTSSTERRELENRRVEIIGVAE